MTNHPNRYKYQVHLTEGQINWLRRVIDELPLGSVADKRKKDAIEQALSVAALMFSSRADRQQSEAA